jgi:hypothetical protein
MIAFQDDKNTNGLIEGVVKLNSAVMREDDKIRLFQMPLEKIL